ncbi:GSCFA domain-containing protein [Ascidiaceihabitans sp.]|uniref:GSCFA domain-containing protein n=1 Tax=Ascidiaceihabitans sp. TaxID=1872644 RepID=UPI003299F3AF
MPNPYSGRPAHTFWKRAVSDRHFSDLDNIIPRIEGLDTAKIATAGSCFAQHIGHNLKIRGLNYMDMEAPSKLLSDAAAAKLGYGIYSCRYGNIYTSRQLLQLVREAFGEAKPLDTIWEKDGRFYDALRPSIEDGGFGSVAEVRVLRERHLRRVRRMFETMDVFVFTMGLTETWASTQDGTVYPTAPGVVAGNYDPALYEFVNLRFSEVMADMEAARARIHQSNPSARFLLTVSPVGLAATATDNHVLTATTHSKSVLRAVAGELSAAHDDVTYFPSYEIIVGQPSRHSLYEPDLREVSAFGVREVMRQFFEVNKIGQAAGPASEEIDNDFGYEQCDDALLTKEFAE